MKNFKHTIIVCTVILGMITQVILNAGISPLVFNNVFALFKPEHIYYAPQFGSIALSSGLIENLRFFNVIPGISDDGQRGYFKDKAPDDDPIMEIILILFPSPAGQLAAERNLSSNMGKYCEPEHVAALLNFSYAVRMYLHKNPKARPFPIKANILLGKRLLNYQDKINNDFAPAQFQQTDLNILLVKIAQAIEFEAKQSFYPRYFVEQIINTFFCHKFADQRAVKTLLSKLDVLQDNSPNISQIDGLFTQDNIKAAIRKIQTSHLLNPDDAWILLHSSIFTRILPYNNGNNPISNGSTQLYNRSIKTLSNKTFQDCTEVTLRHIINFFIYDHTNKTFNIASINQLIEKNPDNQYLQNLKDFYDFQAPDKANAGDRTLRSAWNKVVADIGADYDIAYLQNFEAEKNNNELKSGMINMMKVFNAVFSLDLSKAPDRQNEQFLINAQTWVQDGFEKLCSILNQQHTCKVSFSHLRKNDTDTDIIGTIHLTVSSLDTNTNIFSFTIQIESAHTEIKKVSMAQPHSVTQLTEDAITAVKTIIGNVSQTITDSLLTLLEQETQPSEIMNPEEPDTLPKNPLYQLFINTINDSYSTMSALNRILGLAQKNIIPHKVAQRLLTNILQSFEWKNEIGTQNNIEMIRNLKAIAEEPDNQHFAATIKKEVQGLGLSSNDDVSLLNFFTNIRYLCLTKNSPVSSITLPAYHALQKLDLQSANNLEYVTFTGSMDNLEEVHLQNSAVKTIIGYDLCPKINEWPKGIKLIKADEAKPSKK